MISPAKLIARSLHLSALTVPFLLQGCATSGALTPTGAPLQDVSTALASGQVRLTCGVSCSGSWGATRRKAKALHDNQLWTDLAIEVGRVGFESDLTYFYLARAAEGLGHTDAAVTYYRLSLSGVHKCAGALNVCDGFNLPSDALARLDRILGSDQKHATTAAQVPQTASAASQPTVTPKSAFESPGQTLSKDRAQELLFGSKIQAKYDEFKKLTNYTGPNVASGSDAVFLRAAKLDSGLITIQIYVSDYYEGEWRFYNSAWDSDGNRLNVTLISRKVGSCGRYGGCSHYEDVGINITREYLEARRASGIRFKLSGRGGDEIFALPGPYISAFLDAVK
jgi:hypothetical protein